MRHQQIASLVFQDTDTISSEANVEGFAWAFLEVPSGDGAVAVTVQILSGDGSTWIDAFTVDDVTNQIKPFTSEELSLFGPMAKVRLKVGSGVSGVKTYYLHLST
jgi:hypothetical protein